MANRAVHWHEGMFLRPHHFQAGARFVDHRIGLTADVLSPYGWGSRSLDIDADALNNARFVVRSLKARLPDGTVVAVPQDGVLPAVDLKAVLDSEPRVTVYLAVPLLQLGRPNVAEADGPTSPLARYRLESQDLEDENTADDRETVAVRRLNVQLLASGQDLSGYAVLPLARLTRSDRADGRPRLEPGYIPPVLACEAWPPLVADILHATYDRVGRKLDVLAAQVQSRGLVFDTSVASASMTDAMVVAQLRALNEISTALWAVAFTPGLHPVAAYAELCRAVGELAVFGPTHRPPPLPRYDHDDLGGCLYRLKLLIDGLLDVFVEPEYKERPFVGAGLRMEVALEPGWVESSWQTFIGVQGTLPPDELIRVLTQPGVLDMKVGSSERVDAIFRYGRAGLGFVPVRTPPRVLPHPDNMTYFRLAAADSPDEWAAVQKSLTLAVRLNENRVVGSMQGQRDLTVQLAGQTNTVRFTLYVVPRRSLGPGE